MSTGHLTFAFESLSPTSSHSQNLQPFIMSAGHLTFAFERVHAEVCDASDTSCLPFSLTVHGLIALDMEADAMEEGKHLQSQLNVLEVKHSQLLKAEQNLREQRNDLEVMRQKVIVYERARVELKQTELRKQLPEMQLTATSCSLVWESSSRSTRPLQTYLPSWGLAASIFSGLNLLLEGTVFRDGKLHPATRYNKVSGATASRGIASVGMASEDWLIPLRHATVERIHRFEHEAGFYSGDGFDKNHAPDLEEGHYNFQKGDQGHGKEYQGQESYEDTAGNSGDGAGLDEMNYDGDETGD
ncbi:hypothetical protein BU16DRAFT_554117 [Lophium mytilinum]|uniref:Uncharacterized protein n=1 Tax=Lophium mytilinum TaxID=390894 RepID=A0A6A6RE86_9PEZI|nr:hypothetical protein BU16DRAFT_554117 [Lophium mytilinum]